MAKTRVINTRFWVDDYISNLDPIEKLLFLYFLTNPSTDICGVYEIPLKTIAVDTGLDKEMVEKIIKRFTKDKKIVYYKGWAAIKNFIKYQTLNPKVIEGVRIGLSKAPHEVLDKLRIDYRYGIDTLSHLNSNPNLNPNLKSSAGDTRKEVKSKREPKPIQWDEYLKKLDDSPQKHIQLIGYYFGKKKLKFDTDMEAEAAISRHSRYSVQLTKAFPEDKVIKALDSALHKYGKEVTLETVYKELTK